MHQGFWRDIKYINHLIYTMNIMYIKKAVLLDIMVRSVNLSVLDIVKTTIHVTTSVVCVPTDVTMDGLEKTVQQVEQFISINK